MQAMDVVSTVLAVLAVMTMIVIITVYNRLDRIQFQIDYRWKKNSSLFLDWASAIERMMQGDADILDRVERFRKAKKVRDKARIANELFLATSRVNELPANLIQYRNKKLDLERKLVEYTQVYTELAEKFNDKTEKGLGRAVAKLLHMRPYPTLNFSSAAERS